MTEPEVRKEEAEDPGVSRGPGETLRPHIPSCCMTGHFQQLFAEGEGQCLLDYCFSGGANTPGHDELPRSPRTSEFPSMLERNSHIRTPDQCPTPAATTSKGF